MLPRFEMRATQTTDFALFTTCKILARVGDMSETVFRAKLMIQALILLLTVGGLSARRSARSESAGWQLAIKERNHSGKI